MNLESQAAPFSLLSINILILNSIVIKETPLLSLMVFLYNAYAHGKTQLGCKPRSSFRFFAVLYFLVFHLRHL